MVAKVSKNAEWLRKSGMAGENRTRSSTTRAKRVMPAGFRE